LRFSVFQCSAVHSDADLIAFSGFAYAAGLILYAMPLVIFGDALTDAGLHISGSVLLLLGAGGTVVSICCFLAGVLLLIAAGLSYLERTKTLKVSLALGDLGGSVRLLEVRCSRCDRYGRERVASLVERYGRDARLLDLRHQLASDCPRRNALYPRA
jgi:hypothetical protein